MEYIDKQGFFSFAELVKDIQQLHSETQNYAKTAINSTQTIRNWLVGCYIVEYEQCGCDRAKYGAGLLVQLEKAIHTKGINVTLLQLSRQFYIKYPQLKETIASIYATASHKLPVASEIRATLSHKLEEENRQTASEKLTTQPDVLIAKLSFSHIREIMRLDDPVVRYFYEQECILGTWSVRELRRQIATNLHIRIGLSHAKAKAMSQINETAEKESLELQVKEPFSFEFLGLRAKDVVTESDIEEALTDHLQDFLLEMGKGFCFEARQKRIIIDGRYYFADLVFYNRILHCNVIVELKNDEFQHEHLGQLNAYVSYYKEYEMHEGDRPPVGILLCTHKGPKMVEFALAGLDNKLFVSTYMLELPNKEELVAFINKYR